MKPTVKEMLESGGIEDVYDIAPSVLKCAYLIVVANETYKQTDVMKDCEYGNVKMDVIVVRETKDECHSAIANVIYALHKVDWEPWNSDQIVIRGMSIVGTPEEMAMDRSSRFRMKVRLYTKTCLELITY